MSKDIRTDQNREPITVDSLLLRIKKSGGFLLEVKDRKSGTRIKAVEQSKKNPGWGFLVRIDCVPTLSHKDVLAKCENIFGGKQ